MRDIPWGTGDWVIRKIIGAESEESWEETREMLKFAGRRHGGRVHCGRSKCVLGREGKARVGGIEKAASG